MHRRIDEGRSGIHDVHDHEHIRHHHHHHESGQATTWNIEPIIGFLNDDRIFLVSLMSDHTYTINWRNGLPLTEAEKRSYCVQILNAQNKLENIRNYILRGSGMSQFGFWTWPFSNKNAGAKTRHVKYYDAGKVDRPINAHHCRIRMRTDLDEI